MEDELKEKQAELAKLQATIKRLTDRKLLDQQLAEARANIAALTPTRGQELMAKHPEATKLVLGIGKGIFISAKKLGQNVAANYELAEKERAAAAKKTKSNRSRKDLEVRGE